MEKKKKQVVIVMKIQSLTRKMKIQQKKRQMMKKMKKLVNLLASRLMLIPSQIQGVYGRTPGVKIEKHKLKNSVNTYFQKGFRILRHWATFFGVE